ncbi:MAG: hypothetical protein KME45_05960 [Stenomitos rutilans HA7619-LM2]|jgi:hypothetical protein|nr:hypothetical protein [Stenomitos rutilans HA7619-LM2]
MENLQDILTLAATVVEYFFFAYLAVAFMVYSLKSPGTALQVRSAAVSSTRSVAVPYKTWKQSATSGASLAGMAS